ncbi:unnamed protein product [Ambrosiozyma monospora]|uniref:Unnamed protein product n=1 Tax=Ambrosiozyma monospora TaxID=43982 RepID=A0ACB5SQX1_AMBMO|nr:unnamed protein product [Ambrosiozyma monospora]
MISWEPLPKLLLGQVTKPFIPFQSNHQQQHIDPKVRANFKTCHPGDLVCLFETEPSKKWARGYIGVLSMPSDFSSATVNMEKLPEMRTSVIVLPWSHVQIVKGVEIKKNQLTYGALLDDEDDNDTDGLRSETASLPSSFLNNKKPQRPSVPVASFILGDDLSKQIPVAMKSIVNHIYDNYIRNDFQNMQTLLNVFNQLEDILISIRYQLFTKSELKAAEKKVIQLLNTIPKTISNSNSKLSESSHFRFKDVSGYQTVIPKNTENAQLYGFSLDDPENTAPNLARIGNNQMFSALSARFPVENADLPLYPEKTKKFVPSTPTHLLVDYKYLSGSCKILPDRSRGLKAYLYLRNTKRRLTEAYSIPVKADSIVSLNKVAAALFTNIPASEISKGRIYLACIINETIVTSEQPPSANGYPNLKTFERGVCAGAVDISRVFSGRQGHLTSGEYHQFTMRLYASYMTKSVEPTIILPGMSPMLAMALSAPNNGWGELIDRIVTGSTKGVAVNPRAQKMVFSLKELKLDSLSNGEGAGEGANIFQSMDLVKSAGYNPLEQQLNPSTYDRVYLRVVKCHHNISAVAQTQLNLKNQFVTIEVSSPTSNNLRFARASNEISKLKWQFTSTSPDESINETIQITGFTPAPTNSNDVLYFDVYSSGLFIGSAKYPLRVYDQIAEIGDLSNPRNVRTVEVFAPGSSTSIGTIVVGLEYVGKNYNVDPYVDMIVNWNTIYDKNQESSSKTLITTLSQVPRSPLPTIIKYFSELIESVLDIYSSANDNHELFSAYGAAEETQFQDLANEAFDTLVHLLDLVIARQDEYACLFESFMESKELPDVGEYLIDDLNRYLGSSESKWNYTGRAICRICPLILKLANKCYDTQTSYISSYQKFAKNVTLFLGSTRELVIIDQLALIDNLELVLDAMRNIFDDYELVQYVTSWTEALGLRGLGVLEDENANALVNKKRSKVHRLIISKMLFLNRSVHSFLIDTENTKTREDLLCNALVCVCQVLHNPVIDVDASRLALGVLLSVMLVSFGPEKRFFDEFHELYLVLCAIYMPLCVQFNKHLKFVQKNCMLEPRRFFTQLFPTTYPFPEFTIDSAVEEESFSELMLEFTVDLNMILEISVGGNYQRIGKILLGELPMPVSYSKLDQFAPSFKEQMSTHFIFDSIDSISTMINSPFYPDSKWIILKAYICAYTEAYCECFDSTIQLFYSDVNSLKDPNLITFASKYLSSYIICMLQCATSKPASIEHLNTIAVNGCYKITKDLRSNAVKSIYGTWNTLGLPATEEEKKRFGLDKLGGLHSVMYTDENYVIVREILLCAMQKNNVCCELASKIFWSIIVCEWTKREGLYELERVTISSLYEIFMNESSYSPESTEIRNFITTLRSFITLDVQDEAYQPIMQFINTMFDFLGAAAELKIIPEGIEFEDDRAFYNINIGSYLLNVDKPELLSSFINSLYGSYVDKKNFTQAALSLELLADTYTWNPNSFLPSCKAPVFPNQSEFKRKESLYRLMAANFEKGNNTEQAVVCYLELLDAYKEYNLSLEGLAFCHGELSKLYNKLEVSGSMESSYFKIAFIGYGFPVSVRGKEFICEGLPFEHITSIHHRLARKYPGSRIISNEEKARELLTKTPFGKFLHIKTVTPMKSSDSGMVSVGLGIGSGLNSLSYTSRQYLNHLNLNTFVTSRRIPGSTNVTNLWIEETTYETQLTFPTLMNRSEIKFTTTVKLSPIKNAVKSLISKIEELSSLEFMIKQNLKDQIDPATIANSSVFSSLSRNLAGTIDSPVNGGVGQYKAFFTSKPQPPPTAGLVFHSTNTDHDFLESVSDYEEDLKYLHNSFDNLIILLNKLLKLHQAIIPAEFKLQHQAMVELFNKNFHTEIETLQLDTQSTLDLEELMGGLVSTNIYSRKYRQKLSFQNDGHQLANSNSNSNFDSHTSSVFGVGEDDVADSFSSYDNDDDDDEEDEDNIFDSGRRISKRVGSDETSGSSFSESSSSSNSNSNSSARSRSDSVCTTLSIPVPRSRSSSGSIGKVNIVGKVGGKNVSNHKYSPSLASSVEDFNDFSTSGSVSYQRGYGASLTAGKKTILNLNRSFL